MGIEELIKALGLEGENAEKLRTFITERDTAAKGKLDKEKEKLETSKEKLKAAESVKEKFDGFMKKIGADIEAEDLDAAVDAALEEFKKAAGNPTPEEVSQIKKELNTLRKQNGTLTADKTAVEEKHAALLKKYHGGLIRQALQKALTDAKIKDPSFIADALAAKVKVGDDDALTFIGKDGGELEISDGVAEFTKQHPDFVANTQSPGAGSGQSGATAKGGVHPLIQKMLEGNKDTTGSSEALNKFFG